VVLPHRRGIDVYHPAMGLGTLLLAGATVFVGAVLVRGLLVPVLGRSGPAAYLAATPARLLLLSVPLVVLLLAVPFTVERMDSHDTVRCGSVANRLDTGASGAPIPQPRECRNGRLVRMAAAGGTAALAVTSVVLVVRRDRRAPRPSASVPA
jgi:hypothetical protein